MDWKISSHEQLDILIFRVSRGQLKFLTAKYNSIRSITIMHAGAGELISYVIHQINSFRSGLVRIIPQKGTLSFV